MAQYPIPPWLQGGGADPASAFVSAFNAGQNASAERARLQQHAHDVSMRLALAEREHQREAQLDYQKLEIQKAYNDAQLGLKEQDLITRQERNAQLAADAANKFALDYQKWQDLADYRQGQLQASGRRADVAEQRLGMEAGQRAAQMAAVNEYRENFNFRVNVLGEDRATVARELSMELGPGIAQGMTGMSGILGGGAGAGGMDFSQIRARPILDESGNQIGKWGVQTGKGSQAVFDVKPPANTNAPVAHWVMDAQGNRTDQRYIPGAAAGGKDKFFKDVPKPPEDVQAAMDRIKRYGLVPEDELKPLRKKQLAEDRKLVAEWRRSLGAGAAVPAGQAVQPSEGDVMYFDPSSPSGLSTNAPTWAK